MGKAATSQKSKTAGVVAAGVNGNGAYDVGYRLGGLSERIRGLDERFDKLEERFDKLEQRFDRQEQRLGRLELELADIKATLRVIIRGMMLIGLPIAGWILIQLIQLIQLVQ